MLYNYAAYGNLKGVLHVLMYLKKKYVVEKYLNMFGLCAMHSPGKKDQSGSRPSRLYLNVITGNRIINDG